MDLIGYELRSEYQGQTDEDPPRPVFGGGVLFVGDGDFHVADQLKEGNGTIVVPTSDGLLVELLDAYPALKRTAVPDGAAPISPYRRRSVEALRHDASLRGIDGMGSAAKERLVEALEAHDRAQLHSPEEAAAVVDRDPDATAAALEDTPPEPPPAPTTTSRRAGGRS